MQQKNMTPHHVIDQVLSTYLEDEVDFIKLVQATKRYKEVLLTLTQDDLNSPDGRSDMTFENGKALGPYWADLCINDIMRTRQFIRGIHKAFNNKIRSNQPLHIMYAGTGPYAALLLPMILRYKDHEVSYTLIEVHPLSMAALTRTLTKLGLDGPNVVLVAQDASKYVIDPHHQPDIIISETMQCGLEREQQVPIFINLMGQSSVQTIFIPEKINLYVGLRSAGVPSECLTPEDHKKENLVFEVSKEKMPALKTHFAAHQFPTVKTIIDKEKAKDHNQLLLLTEIQVYQDEWITTNQSSLTIPLYKYSIPKNLTNSLMVETQYQISDHPKLAYKVSPYA